MPFAHVINQQDYQQQDRLVPFKTIFLPAVAAATGNIRDQRPTRTSTRGRKHGSESPTESPHVSISSHLHAIDVAVAHGVEQLQHGACPGQRQLA
jgi:hypothetical protein